VHLLEWVAHGARSEQVDSNKREGCAAVARQVGYTSEFAFSRAFTRHHHVPPGRYRRGTRASEQLTGS